MNILNLNPGYILTAQKGVTHGAKTVKTTEIVKILFTG